MTEHNLPPDEAALQTALAAAQAEGVALRGALQDFVDKCNRGEARSVRSYTMFKALLAAPSSVDALREFGERVARIAIVEGDRTHTGAGDERDPEELRQRAETIVACVLSPEGKVTP